MKHQIRTLDDGDVVVDYGTIWFRIKKKSGAIIKKTAKNGRVITSMPSDGEVKKILWLIGAPR